MKLKGFPVYKVVRKGVKDCVTMYVKHPEKVKMYFMLKERSTAYKYTITRVER